MNFLNEKYNIDVRSSIFWRNSTLEMAEKIISKLKGDRAKEINKSKLETQGYERKRLGNTGQREKNPTYI